jgi:hypothetical protein
MTFNLPLIATAVALALGASAPDARGACVTDMPGTGFGAGDEQGYIRPLVGLGELGWYTENACGTCPAYSFLRGIALPRTRTSGCMTELLAASQRQGAFWSFLGLPDRYNASKKIIQDVLNHMGLESFQKGGRFPSLSGLKSSELGVDVLYRALPCIYGLETANTFDPNLLGTCTDPNSSAAGIGQVLKSTFALYEEYPWQRQFATAYGTVFSEELFEQMPRNPKMQVAASIAVFLDSMAGRALTSDAKGAATAKSIFMRYGDGTPAYGEAAYACFTCMFHPKGEPEREIGCLKKGVAVRERILRAKKVAPAKGARKGRRK